MTNFYLYIFYKIFLIFNLYLETEQQKEWKKECKKGIKNKEESDKFKEKLEKECGTYMLIPN